MSIRSGGILRVQKASKLFRPLALEGSQIKGDGENSSVSQRLLNNIGLVRPSKTSGAFHLLPVAIKVLEKLKGIVDDEMMGIGAQKIQMPTLTSTSLWQTSGRLQDGGNELIKVKDRNSRDYILSPTHEESVCDLLNLIRLNRKALPLRLYQMTEKFRDEFRPRFGLLRAREFLMKDLYTFDETEMTARETYEEVTKSYASILQTLAVPWLKVGGSSGNMGGSYSHEFQILADIGEDLLCICKSCQWATNSELLHSDPSCPKCSKKDFSQTKGIEVGHSFLLGTRYSSLLGPEFNGIPLEMGCYGIGLSRLLAAVIEANHVKSDLGEEMRWPRAIAPFTLAIIPPKAGSKEESAAGNILQSFYEGTFKDFKDVLIDDRTDWSIGRRVKDLRYLGIENIIIIGRKILSASPEIELTSLLWKDPFVKTRTIGLAQIPQLLQQIANEK